MNGGSLSTWNGRDPGKKWGKMIIGSLFLHGFLFLLFLNVVPRGAGFRFQEPAYVVDLVSLGGGPAPGPEAAPQKAPASAPVPSPPAPPKQTVSIPKPPPPVEKKTVRPQEDSRVLDTALERIKKKIDQEKSLERSFHRLENKVKNDEALEQALTRLERKTAQEKGGGASPTGGPGGEGNISSASPAGSPGVGLQFQIYHASLRARIKKNWVLPEGLLKKNDISADITIRISRNGKVEDFRFERKSGVGSFDQEVIRTLQKSDPLPPLPEGYPRSTYEVVLTFHSKDLGGN